eukprot:TRINITY_DN984_c0_g1_i3.p2 TRINITY_DN984_c0_g1~~TRINITY_DN984_c0_g1_i3.p2  ORF type:complete len:155 (-),score=13.06 TRINITY_DN984_c0_g1_i3:490-954(-)
MRRTVVVYTRLDWLTSVAAGPSDTSAPSHVGQAACLRRGSAQLERAVLLDIPASMTPTLAKRSAVLINFHPAASASHSRPTVVTLASSAFMKIPSIHGIPHNLDVSVPKMMAPPVNKCSQKLRSPDWDWPVQMPTPLEKGRGVRNPMPMEQCHI